MSDNDEKEQGAEVEEPTAEPETPSPETPPEEEPKEGQKPDDDKFMRFTRKVTASTEHLIGTSYRKARDAVGSGKFEPRAGIRILEGVLDWAKETFPAGMFDSLAEGCVKYGHYGLCLAQILTVILGLTAAFRFTNWIYFVYGIGIAILLTILQYAANRFLNAGDELIESSPSRLRSVAFLDCLSLLTEVLGILLFVSFLMRARMLGQWSLAWVGLGVFALLDAVAYIALHPQMTNTAVGEDVGAGEEAIGIMSFFVKAVVRIVPLAFGIGTIIGTVGLFFGTFSLMRTGVSAAALAALKLIILCTCLPFLSYIIFAFYHLVIDLLRAILELPRKLDRIAGPGGETD